jgi:hypothetical protein
VRLNVLRPVQYTTLAEADTLLLYKNHNFLPPTKYFSFHRTTITWLPDHVVYTDMGELTFTPIDEIEQVTWHTALMNPVANLEMVPRFGPL